MSKQRYRMDAEELALLERDGFVLRTAVFDAAECQRFAGDCEALVDRLVADKKHAKTRVGSYVFEWQAEINTTVKWEPEALDLVQGIEHFTHLSPALDTWGNDPRLIEPCKDIVGENHIAIFTEKLNLKRARRGGPIVLHQDFPYWEHFAETASRIATAMIFLDEANVENGCLEVAPGSHRAGKHRQRNVEGFGALEMDTESFDMTRLQPLNAQAGDVVFFGAFLVHRSLPNLSSNDRRALLYSYQPAGFPHARNLTKKRRADQMQGSAKLTAE